MLPSKSSAANRWLWRIVVASVIFIPILISLRGKDNFRLPKELLFRGEVVVLASICIALLSRNLIARPTRWKDPELIIPAAVLLWSFLSTLAATNRILSFSAFAWIAGWTLVFVVTTALAREHLLSAVYAAILPAIINSAVLLLQESDFWNPFFPGKSLEHVYHSGLIGNPNDIGVFLVAPAVACFALIFVSRTRRFLHVAATLFIVIALVANHTLTALVAVVAGFLATVFLLSRRRAVAAIIVATILVVGLVRFYPPLRFRYELATRFVATGNYDSVLSGRMIPSAAAFQMFLDRPILGVGPGCFKWEFFPYKVRVMERYKNLVLSGTTVNYGEAHNDHLQILAESGVPGYALFAAALIVIASASLRRRKATTDLAPEAKFSRLASFPLAVAFAVVALGQFPLELAASTAVNIYLFALCRAWKPITPDPVAT